jgi:hypothetical protein
MKRVKKFLSKTNNPDLGINKKTGRIVLKHPNDASQTIETNLLLEYFTP